jgi:hypothetical protein
MHRFEGAGMVESDCDFDTSRSAAVNGRSRLQSETFSNKRDSLFGLSVSSPAYPVGPESPVTNMPTPSHCTGSLNSQ